MTKSREDEIIKALLSLISVVAWEGIKRRLIRQPVGWLLGVFSFNKTFSKNVKDTLQESINESLSTPIQQLENLLGTPSYMGDVKVHFWPGLDAFWVLATLFIFVAISVDIFCWWRQSEASWQYRI